MNLGPVAKDPGYFHLHHDSHLETVLADYKWEIRFVRTHPAFFLDL